MEQRFFGLNDLVRADCYDCKGCSTCCCGMGDSILLDPFDAYQFLKYDGVHFQQLLNEKKVGLTVREGMILPHIQMSKEQDQCGMLTADGRCSIHDHRPGLCRLFPLGRNFADAKMTYILLQDACRMKSRGKIKVARLLGVEPAVKYHEFVLHWHDFRCEMADILHGANEEQERQLNMYLLHWFYLTPYDLSEAADDFYTQAEYRMRRIRNAFT